MAIITKNNYIIPVIRIGAKEFGGSSLNIPTQEYVLSLSCGIDTTQFTGNVSFNHATNEMRIDGAGNFFVKDLKKAIELLGNYNQIRVWGGRDGNTGFINGTRIWKGKGDGYNVYNRNGLLVEGWNIVNMNVGGIIIKGPFLTEV